MKVVPLAWNEKPGSICRLRYLHSVIPPQRKTDLAVECEKDILARRPEGGTNGNAIRQDNRPVGQGMRAYRRQNNAVESWIEYRTTGSK